MSSRLDTKLISKGQLSLAIPLWVNTVSTSESWEINQQLHNILAPYINNFIHHHMVAKKIKYNTHKVNKQ